MPSMDFLYDIIEKLSEEDIDYIIVSIRKGKTQDKADLFYRISDESTETANTLLEKVSSLINEPSEEPLKDDFTKAKVSGKNNKNLPAKKKAPKKKRGRPRKKRGED
jgi:transposase